MPPERDFTVVAYIGYRSVPVTLGKCKARTADYAIKRITTLQHVSHFLEDIHGANAIVAFS